MNYHGRDSRFVQPCLRFRRETEKRASDRKLTDLAKSLVNQDTVAA
jgi:hypothetical protein